MILSYSPVPLRVPQLLAGEICYRKLLNNVPRLTSLFLIYQWFLCLPPKGITCSQVLVYMEEINPKTTERRIVLSSRLLHHLFCVSVIQHVVPPMNNIYYNCKMISEARKKPTILIFSSGGRQGVKLINYNKISSYIIIHRNIVLYAPWY